MSEHTPLPWKAVDTFKVFASGDLLASCGGYVGHPRFSDEVKEANAEYINNRLHRAWRLRVTNSLTHVEFVAVVLYEVRYKDAISNYKNA